MEKRNLIAIVALGLLGLGAYAVLKAPEKGQRIGPAPRPFPVIKAASIGTVELTSEKQEKTVLTKKDGKWRVTSPKDWPADQAAVKSLTDGLERLTFGDVVTDSAEKQTEYGLLDGKAERVVVKDAAGVTLADFLIGKSIGGFTMLRQSGKNDVWQASGIYAYMANRDSQGWRDHSVFDFKPAQANKFTVEFGANKLVVSKGNAAGDATKPDDAKWAISESSGEAPKSSEPFDAAQVSAAVQALSTLRATDFADDKKPEEVGLGKGALTLTVDGPNPFSTVSLLVGAANGDDFYVKAGDASTLYRVKKYALEKIALKPVDFRDKTLIKAKQDEITSVEVVSGAGQVLLAREANKWVFGKDKVAADEGKVKPVLAALENLAGASFSDEKDPVKTGLGKPASTITLHLKSGPALTLRVGATTKDQASYYVQRVGAPEIVLVKKFVLDRALKKPSDFSTKTEVAVTAAAKKTPPPKK